VKLRPIHDYLVVRPDEPENKTPSGLHLPNPAKQSRGVILAAGPGNRHAKTAAVIPIQVKAGDRVVYLEHVAKEVEVDGEKLTVITERDVIGVIEGTARAKKASQAVYAA